MPLDRVPSLKPLVIGFNMYPVILLLCNILFSSSLTIAEKLFEKYLHLPAQS